MLKNSKTVNKICSRFVWKVVVFQTQTLRFIEIFFKQIIVFVLQFFSHIQRMYLHPDYEYLKKTIEEYIIFKTVKGTVLIPEKFSLFNQGGIHE